MSPTGNGSRNVKAMFRSRFRYLVLNSSTSAALAASAASVDLNRVLDHEPAVLDQPEDGNEEPANDSIKDDKFPHHNSNEISEGLAGRGQREAGTPAADAASARLE